MIKVSKAVKNKVSKAVKKVKNEHRRNIKKGIIRSKAME